MVKLLVSFFIAGFFSAQSFASPINVDQALSMPETKVEANLADSHPSVLYAYAKRLFESGQKDDAVFWFYAGQLRYRYHLAANPGLPQDLEPALLASLNATIGQTINEWAGGSTKMWVVSIDKALTWDAANANATTPKDKHAKALAETRKGLSEFRNYIANNEAEISSQRKSRGLEVR
jgi:hypothetical protein